MSKDLTIFLGRFSPLHLGHAQVLNRAIDTSKAVLILIGSAGQARTTKNPFTFEERRDMIIKYIHSLPAKTLPIIKIKPIYDHPYNDQAWIRGVQDAVDNTKTELEHVIGLNPEVYLTGCDRDKSTWYLNAFGNLFIRDLTDKYSDGMQYSATNVREILFSDRLDVSVLKYMVPPTTLNFLKEFELSSTFSNLQKEFKYIESYKHDWDSAPYPPTFVTIDSCVVQSGHILINVRANFPGVGLWCLPGGFLEQDEKLIDGAVRELIEETKIELSKAQLYGSIKAKETFDHPDRSLRGRTITTCFLYKLDDSKPLPKVKPQKGEVQKVMWVPINEVLNHPENFFEDHFHIITQMIGKIQN